MEIGVGLKWTLGIVIAIYIIVMYALAFVAQGKVESSEDYIVAGRKLPLSLAWMTLLATWFGAGTLLTAADEVSAEGLQAAALDPIGPGFCLLLAGLFFAGPLWRMKLLTLPDLYRRKYGSFAEVVASLIMIPSYFGWIAAQYIALAKMLELYFGLDLTIGIAAVAIVGAGYTVAGGMWSVTLTDAVQISLVLLGLIVLAFVVLWEIGEGQLLAGYTKILAQTPGEHLQVVPRHSASAFWEWVAVLMVATLGNLPGQDLMQRVFAAKSARVAQGACLIAGVAYLSFGLIPVGLGLAANLLPHEIEASVLPTLAAAFLSPPVAIIFVLALMSAVLSTIDSAIIAPSSVMAQNLLSRCTKIEPLLLNRIATLIVATGALVMAYTGQTAYELLEGAYAMTLVGLFVPLVFGIYTDPRNRWSGPASMLAGAIVWGLHQPRGYETFLEPWLAETFPVPLEIAATGISLLAYFVFEPPWQMRWAKPPEEMESNQAS
ncbi:sodium:solute symporter family protein [Blastopirellula sp. JC732]|uniref:Sodium:solute symporter family protein n=1 Tax=Blastopirellula sediminis TaxID=2894196 RepID=A0A9X1SGG7_9BACT|nr:sodium:solute symporter family protein [Blastopirellula sediminis]MCC9608547.1 sodium:solute symporter family protein [Blastopirellula sediminis]MCC9628676.1 sodium:solute symporter family protein [Blastopirellula sediminis]